MQGLGAYQGSSSTSDLRPPSEGEGGEEGSDSASLSSSSSPSSPSPSPLRRNNHGGQWSTTRHCSRYARSVTGRASGATPAAGWYQHSARQYQGPRGSAVAAYGHA
eukprot:569106-Rhodomonas_salina.1